LHLSACHTGLNSLSRNELLNTYLLLALVVPLPDLQELVLVHGKLEQKVTLEIVGTPPKQDKAVQRLAQVGIAQLAQGTRDNLLVDSANSGNTDRKAVPRVDTLLLDVLLDLDHLLRALLDSHVARGLVDEAAAGHVLNALLLDLDVEQDKRMEANGGVLGDAVVEGRGLPVVEEEDHGHGLAEVVQLQAGGANAGQDAGVGHGARGN
jgi:hypothetical protein